MPPKLIKHGTNAGYRAELGAGGPENVCQRCHNAHLVYQTQYTKTARAKGIKYTAHEILDHKYVSEPGTVRRGAATPSATAVGQPYGDFTVTAEPRTQERGPSLLERMKALTQSDAESESDNEYVSETEYPSYITPNSVDPDPDPEGAEYQQIPNDSAEYVINAAGMAKIEDNLGTYLSIFGITMEMVDPYCGPILAENMDTIVKKWSRVIAKYPKAAEMFMDGKGGTLMAWISAIQATWPFLYAMYEHHFAKTVQVSGGQIYRARNGQKMPDATTPPMQDNFNYTAG